MKTVDKLGRLLMVFGFVVLALYAAARIHGIVLSRAAVQRFEALQQRTPNNSASAAEPQLTTSQPNFVLWSEKRVENYEKSLSRDLVPPLAVLRIPKIHLEVPVLEGTDDLTLNRGIGRIAGTAHLGENGNVGIAGHRDGFFRGLKDIQIGDRIDLEEPGRTVTYVVDQLQIVKPNEVSVLRRTSAPSLTLVTCYPFYFIGSAPKRFIVHASRPDSQSQGNSSSSR